MFCLKIVQLFHTKVWESTLLRSHKREKKNQTHAHPSHDQNTHTHTHSHTHAHTNSPALCSFARSLDIFIMVMWGTKALPSKLMFCFSTLALTEAGHNTSKNTDHVSGVQFKNQSALNWSNSSCCCVCVTLLCLCDNGMFAVVSV